MAELGNHITGPPWDHSDGNDTGDGYVMGPFGDGVSGTITEMHIAMTGSTGNNPPYRPLIYAADGSDPGDLIAALDEIIVAEAAAWVNITSLSIPFTGPIYIGFLQGAIPGVSYYGYDDAGGPGFYKHTMATYSSTGDPVTDYPSAGGTDWPKTTDTPTTAQAVGVYVVYTPGEGGGADVSVTGVRALVYA